MNHNPALVTLSGPLAARPVTESEYQNLSDFNAGLVFLHMVGNLYPGITFGQLPALAMASVSGERMSGWLTDLGHITGSVQRSVGSVIKDAIGVGGDAGGSAIRLITDKQVISGASQIAAAAATDGGSAALSGSGDDLSSFVSKLGSSFKSMVSSKSSDGQAAQASILGIPSSVLPWALGGAALLFVFFGQRERPVYIRK